MIVVILSYNVHYEKRHIPSFSLVISPSLAARSLDNTPYPFYNVTESQNPFSLWRERLFPTIKLEKANREKRRFHEGPRPVI